MACQFLVELADTALGLLVLGDVADDGLEQRAIAQVETIQAHFGWEADPVGPTVFPLEYWGPCSSANVIFSTALSAEDWPSGCTDGENATGDAPTISSREHPNISSARALQSMKRSNRIRRIASPAVSNSVRCSELTLAKRVLDASIYGF